MSKNWSVSTLFWSILIVLHADPALAGQAQVDAAAFHQILENTWKSGSKSDLNEYLHFIPSKEIEKALGASSISEAFVHTKSQNVATLRDSSLLTSVPSKKIDVDAILSAQFNKVPLTVVLVPGVFGEFIPTRAFEDIFDKSQDAQDAWVKTVEAAKDQPEASDESYLLSEGKKVRPLHELVNVGAMRTETGVDLARVIIFRTHLGGMESLGDFKVRAEQFNRRLDKYLSLTGPQKLLFIGYSRGTVIGLEMLARAKFENKAWLQDSVGLVSLGGVVWGSALADNTKKSNEPMAEAVTRVEKLRSTLVPASAFSRAAWDNTKEWTSFGRDMLTISRKMQSNQNRPSNKELINSPISLNLDPRGILEIFAAVEKQFNLLGWGFWTDYENNIKKFQLFSESILLAVDELRSERREQWWQDSVLPNNLTYYALTGAMANPERSNALAGDYEKRAFDTKIGYSQRSYDDLMLLQNHLDYVAASGQELNDSQVSVVQASFLPNAIAKLNPANRGLKTKFLGTLGTHHWGLALRIVNKMRDGRMNPAPRADILKALAAQAVLDMK